MRSTCYITSCNITEHIVTRTREVLCSDGVLRNVVFPLCFHAVDWPEQCNITGLMKSTQAGHSCNMCHISKSLLFNTDLGLARTLEMLEQHRHDCETEANSTDANGRPTRGCVGRAEEMYKAVSMRKLAVPVRYITLRNII